MVDRKENDSLFDKNVLLNSLQSGETLLEPPEHSEGDLRDVYGYEIYPIRDEVGGEGNSVFLVMESEGDAVEPVELVGPVTLTISPVAGEGLVLVYTPGLGVSPNLLTADGSPNDGGSIELSAGDSYAYLNIGQGQGPFVIRDDSRSTEDGRLHFDPAYEISATNPELLKALAGFGIQSAPE